MAIPIVPRIGESGFCNYLLRVRFNPFRLAKLDQTPGGLIELNAALLGRLVMRIPGRT
ncbi:hypothetical protein PUN4_410139 [Paraburkholderia unamae]|nr:hypothetical protein PUN4_410139 [Paraburkholderia unamae]